MKGNAIFSSWKEDFIKLFFPTIVLLPLVFLPSLESIAWGLIVILSIFDIGHVLSTGVESVFDSKIRCDSTINKLILLGVFISATVVILFPSNVHKIFFYSLVFHNVRQGLGIMLLYYKKDPEKKLSINRLKFIYYIFTFFTVVVFHFRKVSLDLGALEKYYTVIELKNYLSLNAIESINYYLIPSFILLYIVCSIYVFFYTSRKTFAGYVFFTGVYVFSYIITENLLFSTLFLMSSHGIPYYFMIQKRIKISSSSNTLSKYSYLALALSLGGGACYYYFFYKNVGNFEEMSAWTKFFIIMPSYIHYALDAHIWTRKNERFRHFLSY